MSTPPLRDPDRYRSNVGIVLISKLGHVFLGRRINSRGPFQWQMPQGGIDDGEDAEEAAYRELEEEVGVPAKLARHLDHTADWIYYDFPPDLLRRLPGRFLGQKQKWFALQFTGSDSDIRLDRHKPEFDAWRWATLSDAPDLIIPFKRQVYSEVADRFKKWTQPLDT